MHLRLSACLLVVLGLCAGSAHAHFADSRAGSGRR